MKIIQLWLSLWLLLCCQLVLSETYVEIPKLSRPVTDLTGTLNNQQIASLESKLLAFKQKKGSEISVLIVPTTQPEDIAEFGNKVADLSKLGREQADDGLIFIIAKNDRKYRIEVGHGLEGAIPDAIAKRITSEIVKPYFKNDDYAGGINAGVDQLIKLIDGEQLPEPEPQQQYSQQDEGGFIFLLFGGLFAGSMLSSLFGRTTGGLLAGFGSGALAYIVLGFGIGAILIGIIVFFLTSARSTGGGGGGWSNGGGYYGGGQGSGSWRGSGSNSSWGGGGGSFGGGGASDSW